MPIVDPFDAPSNKIVDPFESSSIVDPFAQEDEGATKAFFRGARQMVQGVGRTAGIVSPENYAETYRKGKEAAQAHPIAAGLGQVAGVAVPVIGAALTAPVSVPLAGTALAASTAGAMMGGSEYARLKEEKATPLEALQGADLASDIGTLGVVIPGGMGTTLGSRVATGIGSNVALGAGQRAVERDIIHKDRPDLQQDIFDPFAVAFDVAGGAVGGVATHVGAPKGVGKAEADIPEPTAHRGSTEQIKSYLDQNEKDIARTEYKIKQIQQDLNEHQFDSPEQAKQYQDARLEEVGQHQQTLNELYASKENAEAMLRGETPQPKVQPTQEMPTGQPPRPEGEPFVRPEEAPKRVTTEHVVDTEDGGTFGVKIMRHEDGSVTIFHDEGTIEYNSEFASGKTNEELLGYTFEPEGYRGSSESPRIDGEQSIGEIGTEPSIRVSEAPVEEITIHPIEDTRPISELDIDTVNDRIGEVRDGVRDEGEFDALIKRRAELENAEFMGPERQVIIKGGTKEERSSFKAMLDEVGLGSEKIDVDLSEGTVRARGGFGEAFAEGDTGKINIAPIKSFQELIEASPKLRAILDALPENQKARFEKLITSAHEIGHMLLYKLLQTDLYKADLDATVRAYDAWVKSNPKEAAAAATLHRAAGKTDVAYYSQFPEFFAQRVSRNLLLGDKAPSGAIGKFIKDFKKVFTALRNKFKVSLAANNVVDDLINRIIADNRAQLEKTGQSIFENVSVKMSLEDAQVAHNVRFDYKSYESLKGAGSPGSPIQNAVRHIEDADTVIKKMAGVEDVGGIASKVVAWRFGIQQRMGIYANNPVIKYASDVVLNSLHTQTQRSMELLSGVTDKATYLAKKGFGVTLKKIKDLDSPAVIFNKASNEDFHAVHQILEKGIGKYSYEESLAMFGADLTPMQRDLYTAATKMYANMYKMSVDSANKLGKKSVLPNMKGWYPAVRKGEFTVNFHIEGLKRLAGYDETGRAVMTDLSHSQSFRTRGEAEAFIKQFESQSSEFKGHLRHNGVEEVSAKEGIDQLADFHRAYTEQRAKLDVDRAALEGGTAPRWVVEEAAKYGGDYQAMLDARMQRMVDLYTTRGGQLGGHAKYRTNVSGSMGSEMFTTVHDAGKAFRDANYKSVDEFTGLMQKMEIEEKLNLLINNEGLLQSHPNTLEFVRLTRDYALNKVDSPLAFKGAKATIDALWEQAWKKTPLHKMEMFGAKKYQDAPVVDIALRKMGSLFYIHALMSRPFFWGAQSIQGLWSLRTMLKDGAGPVSATVSAGRGMWQMLRPDREFLEALYHTSQTSHTFDPQFIKDINSHALGDFMQEGSKGRLLFELITGEKQSTMADTFSRLMSYSMMFEHYKELGFKGEELANLAAKATDENMVQYGRQYKAPMYQKMGMLGDLVSPLHTFTNAALGNMISDIGEMVRAPGGKAKLKASLPFMATVAMTGLMTGILGTPLVAEYEAMRLLINKLSNMLGGEDLLPSTVDWALSGDNTFSNRVVSHGLISASTMPLTDNQGLDIGASNRWQPIFDGITQGQDSFMQFIPVVNWYMQRAGDVETILGHATGIRPASEAERRTAAMNVTPGWYKGVVDDLLFGAVDREMVPDTKGHALLPQTKTERAAKYLGGSTISSSVERLRQRRLKEQEMRDQPKINNLVQRVADAVTRQDQETVQKLVVQLAKDYMVPEKIIESRVEKELVKRKVPKGMLQFVSPSGSMSTQQQQRYLKYQETYGTPDLEQYQSGDMNENQ